MQLPLYEVRDRRMKEWFWIDNLLLDEYAKVLGPNAMMVYMALSRHADNDDQTCWPSMDTIAEKCGLKSRNTVAKGIKVLQEYGLVEVQESINPSNGKRLNNVYTLLSRKHWKLEVAPKPKPVVSMTPAPSTVPLQIPGTETRPDLPANVNPEMWDEWVTFRKEIRKKLTPTTIKRQLKQLEAAGAAANDMILQSIQNGWTGLFPVKGTVKKPENKKEAPAGKYSAVGSKIATS